MSEDQIQEEVSMHELREQEQYATEQLLARMKTLSMEQIQTYIEQASINSEDMKGNSLLHAALSLNNKDEGEVVQIVQWMIERGADVNKINDNKESPLVWSVYLGLLSVARSLIDSRADQNIKVDGTTLQHFAAASPFCRALEFLKLTFECDFEVMDIKGRTPLMYAAERDLTIHIKWLIANGVDVMKVDNEGETALFKAVRHKSAGAVWALLEVEPYKQLRVKNRHQVNVLHVAEASKLQIYWDLKRLAERESHFLLPWFDRWTGNIYRIKSRRWTAFLWKIFFVMLEVLVLFQTGLYFFQRDTIVSIFFLLSMAFGGFLHVKLFYSNPGYIPTSVNNSTETYSQALLVPQHITDYKRAVMLATKERVCVTCKTVVPRRSKHCRELDRCVYRYDHYCPFVGNAVGLKNHSFFLSFLAWHVGSLAIYFYLTFRSLSLTDEDLSPIKKHVIVQLLISIVAGLGCVGMLVFAGSLLAHHLYLVATNITTNEYMNYTKYDYLMDDGRFKNSYNQGFKRNCFEFWFEYRKRTTFDTDNNFSPMADL